MKNIFEKLLKCSIEKRISIIEDESTDSFRIFNGSGDGIDGLIIDRYGDFLLIQAFNEKVDAEISEIIPLIEKIIKSLPFAVSGVLHKSRDEKATAQKAYDSRLILGNNPPEKHLVKQLGIIAEVDLIHGLNTGLFLDMREIRQSLTPFFAGVQNMLNLFSYTGMFSAHAIKNGVKSACNVDISSTVLRRAKTNYALNDIRVDGRDFIQEDSGKFLRRAVKKGEQYSFVVFDPPTFARGKNGSFSVKTDYSSYLGMISEITGRYALTVINTHSVSEKDYMSFHPAEWKNIFIKHESDDFPVKGDYYLKAGLWEIK